MGSFFSVPLVIAGLASMVASAWVLAYAGLPYTPLDQVLAQDNPYGDSGYFDGGQLVLPGEGQPDLELSPAT